MAWQDEPGVVEVRLSASTAHECQSALSGPSELVVGEPLSVLRISPEALANLAEQTRTGLDLHSWLMSQIALQAVPQPVQEWLTVVFQKLDGWPRTSNASAKKWREARERRWALAEFILTSEQTDPSMPNKERLEFACCHLYVQGPGDKRRRLEGIRFKTLERDFYDPAFQGMLDRLRKAGAFAKNSRVFRYLLWKPLLKRVGDKLGK
jgi:hypothetical protein